VKVTTQTLEDRQIEIAIEVEDERVQQALQRTAKKIAGDINIPGFRRGKAPYGVVVRSIGEETLYDEMFRELGPKLIEEALLEADIMPFRPVDLRDMQLKPLSFKIIVPLPPVIDLGNYRSLRVPFQVPEVPEENVDEVLRTIQQRNTVLEPAGDGPAEMSQVAVLDISGTTADGRPIDFSELVDESGGVTLALDEQRDLLPGFSAKLVGMMVGEEKEFDLEFPQDADDEEPGDEEGESPQVEQAHFTVKLNELKKFYVPPLDDALAQTIGNYDSLDQLRQVLRESMERTAKSQAEGAYVDTCVERLAQEAKIEFPPVLADEELERVIKEVEQRLSKQKMSLKQLLDMKKQSEEEYRQEMRPRAVSRVRQGLALGQFIEAEDLEGEAQQGEEIINEAIARLTAICKGEVDFEAEAVAESVQAEIAEPEPAEGESESGGE